MVALIVILCAVISLILAGYNLYQSQWYLTERFREPKINWFTYLRLDRRYFTDTGWEYRNRAIWIPIIVLGTAGFILLLLKLFNVGL